MKKHLIAGIVPGIILTAVSFLPVILAYHNYRNLKTLGDYRIVRVFLYPTIGVAIAAIIVFFSIFRKDKGDYFPAL